MLLNTPQCIGHSLSQERIIWPQISIEPRFRKPDRTYKLDRHTNELLRRLRSVTEFIWGKISDTSSLKRTFFPPHFSKESVNTFQCFHCHIIKDMLVYFISWMSENEQVAACLNNFQRISVTRTLYPESEEKSANVSGNFPFLAKLKGHKFTFKWIFKGILWVFSMSLQVLLELLCWKAVNFSCNKIDITFNCFLSALSHICRFFFF